MAVTGRRALVLGGTRFVGRHLVDALLAGGWRVWLFNRGLTGPGLFPDVTQLVGDRHGDVSALAGGEWDAVFDVSAYHPSEVDRTAQVLRGRCGHYVFVSSISAYAALPVTGLGEDTALATVTGPVPDEVDSDSYGPLKALCEVRVADLFHSCTIIRSTIVVGPHDPTDRFTYWVQRLSEPGAHVLPPDPTVALQCIDVRDLADFTVVAADSRLRGAFNAAAPPLRFADLVAAIIAETGVVFRWVPLSAADMAAEGVRPWSDLPLVLPFDDVGMRGMFGVSTERAVAAGLVVRPLRDTVRDTLSWAIGRGGGLRAGLSQEREADLVARRP